MTKRTRSLTGQRCKFKVPGKDHTRFFFGILCAGRKDLCTVVRDNGMIYQLNSQYVWIDNNVCVATRAKPAGEEDDEELL